MHNLIVMYIVVGVALESPSADTRPGIGEMSMLIVHGSKCSGHITCMDHKNKRDAFLRAYAFPI
jgi:hypothetical protein